MINMTAHHDQVSTRLIWKDSSRAHPDTGTNDLGGCTVPARLFPETQLQTVAHSVTVQNGSVREVKRSMPFGLGRCRQNGLGSKSEMLHDQSDEGPYLIQVYPL
jgi:hypothetical protein